MQRRVQHQTGEGMRSISNLVFQFQEFAKLRPQVRVEVSSISNRFLSKCDRLSDDYICDKQKLRSPNYVHRHDCVELRDQSKLLGLCSKHNDRHRAQRVRVLKVELHGDKEFVQILLI
jgi:hypothetical protein